MTGAVEDMSELLGQIYETALDVAAWPATLEAACRFVGAPMGAIGSYAVVPKRYDVQVFFGYETRWIQLYRDKYGAMNPLAGSTNGQGLGEVKCLSAAGLLGAFEGQPMYEEWVKPQRILDIAEVVLDATPEHAATLAFVTRIDDGPFTSDHLGRIERLYPHVRRSVLISRLLTMHRRVDGEFSPVVEGLAAGVFVLSASGAVLRTNSSADAMLSKRLLTAPRGVLRFKSEAADSALRDALRAAGCDLGMPEKKGASIILDGFDGRRFVAHLLPLSPSAAKHDFEAPEGKVALLIGETNPRLEGALVTLTDTYGLTAAESRVAKALAEVGPTPLVARSMGVTVATVRTHMRSLYQKTGVRRQADIVSLLRGLASPFD